MTVKTTPAPREGDVQATLGTWADVTEDVAYGAHPSDTDFPSFAPYGALWIVNDIAYVCKNTSGCTVAADWVEVPVGAARVLALWQDEPRVDDGGTTLSLLGSDRGLRCGATTTPVREKWGVQDTASGGHAFCQRQDDAL